MRSNQDQKKRPAPLSDAGSISGSDDEFPELDGVLSQSEDGSDLDPSDVEDDENEVKGATYNNGNQGEAEYEDGDEFDSEASSDKVDDDLDREVAESGGGAASLTTRPGAAAQSDDDDEPNYRVTTDANGGVRYEYPDVDPVYDSDDSAREDANTIGNIPLSFYESYPHIGYTIDGKKIMRPAAGAALDSLLDSIEVPKDWTGLTDPATGLPLKISHQERELLARIQMGEIPEDGYDPYPDTVEYFTSIEEKMPLSSAPEPKRRFVPSKHEAKKIAKLVRLIREGKLMPYKPPEEAEEEEEEEDERCFDLWANEEPTEPHIMNIPAPKVQPPGHDQSINPPEEYLPTPKEREEYHAQDPEDREKGYLPRKYDSLRRVPAYDNLPKERFERCLDLYLAPRVRKNRLNIDPMSLLPKLPRPEDLKPFPTLCQTVFKGHDGRVRSVSVSPVGGFVASGSDDGTVCVWDLNGHLEYRVKLSSDDAVDNVQWRPTKDTLILAATAGDDIYMMVPDAIGEDSITQETSRDVLDAGFGYAATSKQGSTTTNGVKKDTPGVWSRPGERLEAMGVLLKITLKMTVKTLRWHRRGDYFCSVSPNGGKSAVAIHQLTKHSTQIPFRRLKGIPQVAQFHPSRPLFFVATKLMIRCYDLQRQQLVKIIQPGARHISSFDIHPGGDNVIVGSYDRRLLWHDLDLSVRPYKTMRFHPKAVRAVKFHKGGFPLFADASDDGTMQIFYGKVVSDMMENPTIVPVKLIKGHKVVAQLGILDIDWHPSHPWLVSAGADGSCKLWC